MEYRLDEQDYDVLELLQRNPQGLRFKELVDALNYTAVQIYETLEKLRLYNHISLLNYKYAYYSITESNVKTIVRKVCCPVCHAIKRVHDEKQARVFCINPDCKTPKGDTRAYEIISRELLKKGIIKRVHHVGGDEYVCGN